MAHPNILLKNLSTSADTATPVFVAICIEDIFPAGAPIPVMPKEVGERRAKCEQKAT